MEPTYLVFSVFLFLFLSLFWLDFSRGEQQYSVFRASSERVARIYSAQGLRYGEGVRISSEFRERNASAVANWFSRIENEICKLGLPSVLICIRLPDLKKKDLRFADFQDSNF